MRANFDWHHLRSDDLRYLSALARTGTLIAAANALGVHHATVSRRIRALEEAVGRSLIVHGADGWELTAAGKIVAAHGERIDEAVQQTASSLSSTDEMSLTGTFRLVAPEGLGTYILVPALLDVRRRHPALNIEIIASTKQLVLHQSGFDLAIALGAVNTSRLWTEQLAEGVLRLYASDTYFESAPRPNTVSELTKHPLIFYVESLLQVDELQLDRYIPGARSALASTSLSMQLEATKQGAGIGLLPGLLADRYPGISPVEVGLPELRVPIMLAARPESAVRPATRVISAAIRERFRQVGSSDGPGQNSGGDQVFRTSEEP